MKSNTDYSNTIIYKITCKDPAITDLYVGHTTNFVQRKNAHMNSCKSPKTANHKCKLYETIRSNGGWSNWRMDIIAFFECDGLLGAKKKEQEYYVSLKATLNSIEPSPLPKEKRTIVKNKKKIETQPIVTNDNKQQIYRCDTCNINYRCSKLLDSHLKTNKHIKRLVCDISNNCYKYTCLPCYYYTNSTRDYNKHCATDKHLNITDQNENKKIKKLLSCNICDYHTSNLRDYNKHCGTRKHIKSIEDTSISSSNSKSTYVCKNCNKQYRERTGLWRHNQKCITPQNNVQIKITEHNSESSPSVISPSILHEHHTSKDDVICELLKELCATNKQNIDLQTQMLEYMKSK